ncbi:lactate utilization protein C [Ureibacillus sp. FSL K6-8385]|uniref:Lactate utilization protein C n=1 Tax=Ureibacillus terrenus TaxID=118246 RepID=A0A540V2U4_9BACL|nr:lactate utilization protein C [Ureibacillus terrenus]MED3662094.1 lactate utilization protein C [Ureibacillus terrenus]MED3763588.1 lactate utilization protein C [Ureibacillus terrenus]TQE91074.1 lactate utilization protein C [Ureibacillus terrenus]
MTIQNRDEFLNQIAKSLGRPVKTKVERPVWKHAPQLEVLKNASQDELVEVLKQQCQNIHTTFVQTDTANLPNVLQQVVTDFGGESVITWNDERFEKFGVKKLMEIWPETGIKVYEWNPDTPKENIRQAEQANIGITISEMTLAESATAMLCSHPKRGRAMNFLPQNMIVLIPKSTIVPRMTQAAQKIHQQIEKGQQLPSCILFMSGPSNSADIESVLIVGVHGPVNATYIVIEDQ